MNRQLIQYLGGVILLLFLTACATIGERYPVSLTYQGGVSSPSQSATSQKVMVFPLEDTRKDPNLIGQRTHLFGQMDTFETTAPAGEKIAELLVEALRQRGWDAHLAGPGMRPEQITGDRVVTGKIQTLWAEAVSHFGYTQIITRIGFDLKIMDPVTGGKMTFKIEDENTPQGGFLSRWIHSRQL